MSVRFQDGGAPAPALPVMASLTAGGAKTSIKRKKKVLVKL
jgi:hypothetical protein